MFSVRSLFWYYLFLCRWIALNRSVKQICTRLVSEFCCTKTLRDLRQVPFATIVALSFLYTSFDMFRPYLAVLVAAGRANHNLILHILSVIREKPCSSLLAGNWLFRSHFISIWITYTFILNDERGRIKVLLEICCWQYLYATSCMPRLSPT